MKIFIWNEKNSHQLEEEEKEKENIHTDIDHPEM